MGERRLVLEGATMLTGPKWRAMPDSAILIEGERITDVSSAGGFGYPEDARVIDCRGKYLLPGFIDMHTHCHTNAAVDFLSQFGPKLEASGHREWFLKLFLAYGVTTVRDVGNFSEIFDLRRTQSGATMAPSIAVAGELMEGSEPLWPLGRKVTDEETARKEVRRQRDLGAEWVKLYVGLEPATARAAIEEAHALGMRAAGHIGATTARQAAGMGIDTLEHALTLVDEEFLSEEDRASLPGTAGGKYNPDRLRKVWLKADMDSNAARDLAQTLRRSGTYVCPTLVVHENIIKGPDKSYRNSAYDYVSQQWLEIWDGRFRVFNPGGEISPHADEAFGKALGLISRLNVAGVRILGGTDAALWNPYAVPGASIHREMELLSSAGLEAETVLSSVTSTAAAAMGLEEEVGTIEAGKRADLVLLRNNPLEAIQNTRDIELVVSRGHTFTPEDVLETIEPLE